MRKPRPRPTKAKPSGKALPPIYVVVDDDGEIVSELIHRNLAAAQLDCEYADDSIVEYSPAPRRSSR